MAVRRRRRTATKRRVSRRPSATNPRRHRRRRARVANPTRRRRRTTVVHHRRRRRAVASNPRHRRRARRHNPTAMRVGEVLKEILYGTGGAILTRVGTSLVVGFIPASLSGSQFVDPVVQAGIACTVIRWGGKKFLGQKQGDLMMLGGLISAGLSLADKVLPNIQGQLTGIIRAPVAVASPAQAALPAGAAAMADVYDVDMVASGFGDVEDVDTGMFNNY